jgi:hypothetical protein
MKELIKKIMSKSEILTNEQIQILLNFSNVFAVENSFGDLLNPPPKSSTIPPQSPPPDHREETKKLFVTK